MSTDRRNAIITFDYELFLGRRTGTIENCLIKPTDIILQTLKKNNSKAIFFVDAPCLLFLKDNLFKDFIRVSRQLQEIAHSGSSIELHIHPQWLQAYKKDNLIGFKTFDNYSLNSLTKSEINDIFRKSIKLLREITNIKISCFRAGGFCIEPFHKVKEAFEICDIIYDFSVGPGASLNAGKLYDYDFSKAPIKPFYHFQDNIIKPDKNGRFIEFPLSTYKSNPIYRLLNRLILKLKNDKIIGDGTGIQEKSYLSFNTYKGWMQFSRGMLTLDYTTFLFFRYLISTHFKTSNLIVVISHPKTFSPESLKNLEYLSKRYNTLNSADLNIYTILKP